MEKVDEEIPHDVITSDTENATHTLVSDAPADKKRKFRKFRAYNRDMWNGPKRENTEMFRRQDNLHRYDSLSSSLCLTQYQKSRGRRLLDNIDVHDVGIGVDAVIFGICVLVANDDVYEGTRYYPHPDAEGDEEFVREAGVLNLTQEKQMSAVEKVRSRVSL